MVRVCVCWCCAGAGIVVVVVVVFFCGFGTVNNASELRGGHAATNACVVNFRFDSLAIFSLRRHATNLFTM